MSYSVNLPNPLFFCGIYFRQICRIKRADLLQKSGIFIRQIYRIKKG